MKTHGIGVASRRLGVSRSLLHAWITAGRVRTRAEPGPPVLVIDESELARLEREGLPAYPVALAAKALGYTRAWLYRLIAAGKIHPRKTAHGILIEGRDVRRMRRDGLPRKSVRK